MGRGHQEEQVKGGVIKNKAGAGRDHVGSGPRARGAFCRNLRGSRSFVNVVMNRELGGTVEGDTFLGDVSVRRSASLPQVKYLGKEAEDKSRFEKAYLGVVEILCNTYKMQELLNVKGYFDLKVTMLGSKLCLLEERALKMLEDIIDRDRVWLSNWFNEIRPCKPCDMDFERLTCLMLRRGGVPCHV